MRKTSTEEWFPGYIYTSEKGYMECINMHPYVYEVKKMQKICKYLIIFTKRHTGRLHQKTMKLFSCKGVGKEQGRGDMKSNDSSLTKSFCAVLTFKSMIMSANSKNTISSENGQ